ncbi:hypothetical protein Enr13x_50220 [Stieleria neptunia]|uniref:Uncharacterized protein n=1 Tax=Stieleria neptunia TaxID=2527979 RepID=A0A518HWC1_9BACT|nr:hypothetical protein [Stieleria neptunia]QDV45148.1 hypothetical protein Enr13x_50220 [Stieleria neptunia]
MSAYSERFQRKELKMMQTAIVSPVNREDSSAPPHSSGAEGLGYALWRFDGVQWQLKKNCALDGAAVGPPPTVPGKFAGQLRATACVAG